MSRRAIPGRTRTLYLRDYKANPPIPQTGTSPISKSKFSPVPEYALFMSYCAVKTDLEEKETNLRSLIHVVALAVTSNVRASWWRQLIRQGQ